MNRRRTWPLGCSCKPLRQDIRRKHLQCNSRRNRSHLLGIHIRQRKWHLRRSCKLSGLDTLHMSWFHNFHHPGLLRRRSCKLLDRCSLPLPPNKNRHPLWLRDCNWRPCHQCIRPLHLRCKFRPHRSQTSSFLRNQNLVLGTCKGQGKWLQNRSCKPTPPNNLDKIQTHTRHWCWPQDCNCRQRNPNIRGWWQCTNHRCQWPLHRS